MSNDATSRSGRRLLSVTVLEARNVLGIDSATSSDTYAKIGFDPHGCKPLNGCGTTLAIPYFLSFTLFVPFVFLNLFIGVIVSSMMEMKRETEEMCLRRLLR